MAGQGRKSRKVERAGGRAARRALRAAGVRGQAVQAGMAGGAYKPLSNRDIQRIHDTALDILENIGIGEPIPEILHYALPGGCTQAEDGRLRFPRSLVEDLVEVSAKGPRSQRRQGLFQHLRRIGQCSGLPATVLPPHGAGGPLRCGAAGGYAGAYPHVWPAVYRG